MEIAGPSVLVAGGKSALGAATVAVENDYLNGEVIRLDSVLRMGPR